MNTFSTQRGKLLWLSTICVSSLILGCLGNFGIRAQQDRDSLIESPRSGTFYLLSAQSMGISSPPYPCNPYPSDWRIPVYLLEDGSYLIADTSEDVNELNNDYSAFGYRVEGNRTSSNSFPLPPLPGGATNGGNVQVTLPTLDTNGLWLELLPGLSQYNSNTNYSTILVHNTLEDGEYMLQSGYVPDPSLWNFETSFVAETNITALVGNIGQNQYDSLFFRVVDISPVAKPDFFVVNQNSAYNELRILKNDSTPDDDYFFLDSINYPDHGAISCEEENVALLEPFQLLYQPDSGFYGVDTFEYWIENCYGGRDSAIVSVFVNQTGNNSPTALTNIVLTLQTNVYSASFNVLTNVTDTNNDTVSLFALTPAKYGTATFDNQGNVTYNRKTNFFGSDSFSYIVTDGKGGFLKKNVTVRQVENANNPGIPVQWLLHHRMSPTYTNSFCDPDLDGLCNLAEFLLTTHPCKSDNPLDIVTITNNTSLSGDVKLPLIGLRENVSEGEMTLLINGVSSVDAHIGQNLDRSWYLYWNTMHLTNGTYSLQIRYNYSQGDTSYVSYGTQKTISIYNPMRFNRINDQFRDTLIISATLAKPVADYTVQLYDEEGDYLTETSGSVTNGVLDLGWNLCNASGEQISFGNISASIIVRLWMSSEQYITNMFDKVYVKEGTVRNANKFTVAWGWDDYSDSLVRGREDIMQHAIVDLLGNPLHSSPYTLLPGGGNVPLGGTTFRYDTETDKTTLTNAFTQGANFFWFGHGLETLFGGNLDKSTITGFEIIDLLENYAWLTRPGKPANNKNPYKFVILNCCKSADASLLEKAFGFEHYPQTSTDTVLDYFCFGREPKAFVGWEGVIYVPSEEDGYFGSTLQGHYKNLLFNIFTSWMGGKELSDCLSPCNEFWNKYRFSGIENWKISGCCDLRKTN